MRSRHMKMGMTHVMKRTEQTKDVANLEKDQRREGRKVQIIVNTYCSIINIIVNS
jgi:hypothetical protein